MLFLNSFAKGCMINQPTVHNLEFKLQIVQVWVVSRISRIIATIGKIAVQTSAKTIEI
jgi:hypothetical protein